jgi:hypothetical protein
MLITTCDICKKGIDGKGTVSVSLLTEKQFIHVDVCLACAGPIAAFLKRYRLDGELLGRGAKTERRRKKKRML